MHETTTLFLVTLPNIHRFKKKIHSHTQQCRTLCMFFLRKPNMLFIWPTGSLRIGQSCVLLVFLSAFLTISVSPIISTFTGRFFAQFSHSLTLWLYKNDLNLDFQLMHDAHSNNFSLPTLTLNVARQGERKNRFDTVIDNYTKELLITVANFKTLH